MRVLDAVEGDTMEVLLSYLFWIGIWYLAFGLVWSLIFTGTYIAKAIKWHREDTTSFDLWSFLGLVVLFFVSWIAWPWSVKHNLPYLIP